MSIVRYSFQDVFKSFNIADEKKQLAVVQSAAFRGGIFDEQFKGNALLSDEEAILLLKKPHFDSIQQGRVEWGSHTQSKWLRSSFAKEKEGKDPMIHFNRWINPEKNPQQISIQEKEFVKIFTTLGLINEHKWPEDKISQVIVHGAPEEHLSERLKFIPKEFKGDVMLVSGPRMLFKNELSFALIVAAWFEKCCDKWKGRYDEAVQRIKNVLKSTDKEWLTDPQGLIQLMLNAMEEKEWPKVSSYYSNPQPYEQAAKNEKRLSPAGLPTVQDLAEFISGRKITPVFSVVPKPPATTNDNAKDLLSGNHLKKNCPLVFISNNSKGAHYMLYHDFMIKEAFKRLEKTQGEYSSHVVTVGPAADRLQFSNGLDTYAKIFFEYLTPQERILVKQKLSAQQAEAEKLEAPKNEGMFSLKKTPEQSGVAVSASHDPRVRQGI